MKKFIGILAIAAIVTSCSDSASNEQRTKDSMDSVTKAAAAAPAPSTAPTMGSGDTANKMGTDTGSGMNNMNKMSGDTASTKMSGGSKMSADTSK